LSHGSQLLLQRLGLWPALGSTAIRHIYVSQADGFGQTRIEAADLGLDALGHVLRLGPLVNTLLDAALKAGVEISFETTVEDIGAGNDCVRATLTSERETRPVQAPLLLQAEGRPERALRQKDYGQSAIVTEAWADSPHRNDAFERFTPEGPLALLPMEDRYSIVWCMSHDQARTRAGFSDHELIGQLNLATTFARKRWRRIGPRATYELALVQSGWPETPRVVLLGNAAQTLHPVAGQGLNLGLRDAFALEALLRQPLTIASINHFQRERQRDRDATVWLTDKYVGIFSNALMPLRIARGTGLAAINLLPFARNWVAQRMMFGPR
jgi:2-octaprenyl-6-methoxyphenol hydroxylase